MLGEVSACPGRAVGWGWCPGVQHPGAFGLGLHKHSCWEGCGLALLFQQLAPKLS